MPPKSSQKKGALSRPEPRARYPPKPSVEDVLATAGMALGLMPFETIKLSSPESHRVYELNDLPAGPVADESALSGIMPWEQGEGAIKEIRDAMKATGAANDEEALATALKVFSSEDVADGGGGGGGGGGSSSSSGGSKSLEQRGPGWYKLRRYKLSASQVASVVRKSPFTSRRKMLYAKVYPKSHAYTGNTYTAWGTLHEPHAEEAFRESFLTPSTGMHTISHCGFVCGRSQMWFGGFSPDGILERRNADQRTLDAIAKETEPETEEGLEDQEQRRQACYTTVHELVEYKCSAHHRDSDRHPYCKYWKNLPEHYLIQLQYSMHLARQRPEYRDMERAWFVCWQPRAIHVTHVPYMPAYAASLAEQAERFYHKKFVPACLRAMGKPGQQADLGDLVEEESGGKRQRDAM